MLVYLAGPLFSTAQRSFLDACACEFRAAGLQCFVPHEHELALGDVSARAIFDTDYEALRRANAVVAWLDGDGTDDGTACEVGIYFGLMQQGAPGRKGIVGLSTDIRRRRLRAAEQYGGINLFLAGTIERVGAICWTVEQVTTQLLAWKAELEASS